MRTCLKDHSRSPASVEASCARTRSRRSSDVEGRESTSPSAVGQMGDGAGPEDVWPDDGGVLGEPLLCAGSPSSREPISACRLVGTARLRARPRSSSPRSRACARSPRGRADSRRRSAAERPRAAGGARVEPSSSATSARSRARRAARARGSRRSPVARDEGRRAVSAARGASTPRTRIGAPPLAVFGSHVAIRSSSVGSAQCRSSKTSTSGRSAASSSSRRRMPQCSSACEISPTAYVPRGVLSAPEEVRERRRDRPQLVRVVRVESARAARRASPRRCRARRRDDARRRP